RAAGPRRAVLPPPEPPDPRGPPALDSTDASAEPRAADADRGLGAAPVRSPAGLPLPSALPGFHAGNVRSADARLSGSRRAAHRQLLSLRMSTRVSAAQTPLLRVAGLQKLFPVRKGFLKRTVGHVRAVDGVDFHIDQGETLGL